MTRLCTEFPSDEEARGALRLACGRLFGLLSRPFRRGDREAYEDCRSVALAAAEHLGIDAERYLISYHRDRLKGAAGD